MSPHLDHSKVTTRLGHTVQRLEKDLSAFTMRQFYSKQKNVYIAGIISFIVLLSFPAFASIPTGRDQPRRQPQTSTTVIKNLTSPKHDGVIPAYCYRSQRSLRSRIKNELPECR
jgi:hypothetical protein